MLLQRVVARKLLQNFLKLKTLERERFKLLQINYEIKVFISKSQKPLKPLTTETVLSAGNLLSNVRRYPSKYLMRISGAEELYYEALGRMKPKPCMVTFHCSTESLCTDNFTDADDDCESRYSPYRIVYVRCDTWSEGCYT